MNIIYKAETEEGRKPTEKSGKKNNSTFLCI